METGRSRRGRRDGGPWPSRLLRAAGAFICAAAGCVSIASASQVAEDAPDSFQPGTSHIASKRVVQRFDFEEPDNPYPVPRNWLREQDTPSNPRPGFPRYNEAAFDFTVGAGLGDGGSGASVRLPTRGGSCALSLVPGSIPVFPQGDYAVSCVVRTSGLKYARAYLTARFLDQNQRPVPGAEARSIPILSENEWTPVSVELMGDRDDVAFLQIELELLQISEQPGASGERRAEHAIQHQDLKGAAWFDDVGIYQLPRIEISSRSQGNVFTRSDAPTLWLNVRDLVGEQLSAHLRVVDLEGRVADEVTLPVNASGRPIEWTPQLAQVGWYDVRMEVLGIRGEVLSRTSTTLAVLPERGRRTSGGDPDDVDAPDAPARANEHARFGLHADSSEPWEGAAIVSYVDRLRLGHVALPVWGDDVLPETIPASIAIIAPTLDELLARGTQVTLCLPGLPRAIAEKYSLESDDPLSIALVKRSEWLPLVNPAFDRYGQRVTRWQIGRVAARASPAGEGGDGAFWGRSLGEAVKSMHESLSLMVPGPIVTVPWRSDLALGALAEASVNGQRPGSIGMVLPSWTTAPAIADFAASWREISAPRPELTIIPQISPEPGTSRPAAIAGFARQVVELWKHFGDAAEGDHSPARFSVNHAWLSQGSRRKHVAPREELVAWNTLAEHLQGRRIVGEYPAPDGVTCYILESLRSGGGAGRADSGGQGGAMVAWNRNDARYTSTIRIYGMADGISIIDPMGRVSRVASRDPSAFTAVDVSVGDMPVFIEGVDSSLARLIASFRIDPELVPAIAAEHEHAILLTNPWSTTMTGKLQIVPPGRSPPGEKRSPRMWKIVPDSVVQIKIPPGETQRIPFAVTLPASEDAGEKDLNVIVLLDSEQFAGPIRLVGKMTVGLPDLDMRPWVDVTPEIHGPDVTVTTVITNLGSADRLLRLQVTAPGVPTRELMLANPPPGEAITKKFVFRDAAALLSGKRIRVSVGDSESAARLSVQVHVP